MHKSRVKLLCIAHCDHSARVRLPVSVPVNIPFLCRDIVPANVLENFRKKLTVSFVVAGKAFVGTELCKPFGYKVINGSVALKLSVDVLSRLRSRGNVLVRRGGNLHDQTLGFLYAYFGGNIGYIAFRF